MAFRGLFFTEAARAPRRVRGRPARDRALGRRRALARGGDRREPGELRGADPDRPGRAADAHLPADPLDDALAEGAHRRDPVGAGVRRRRVGLARRHGGRAGRDGDLLHAVARAGPPGGGAGDRRGVLRAADRGAARRAAGGARPRASSPPSSRPRARTSRRMPPVAEITPPTVTDATPGVSLDVRADFPIFARRFDGRPLDLPRLGRDLAEAGGRDRRAGRALRATTRTSTAASTRSPRRPTPRTTARAGGSPRSWARSRETTIFTKNVTEAINLVAYAWGRANVGPGDAVLITQMEHHANIVPWQVLCRERGRGAALPGGRRARRAVARRSWTPSSRAATCGWWRSRTSRTCSARSTRSRR